MHRPRIFLSLVEIAGYYSSLKIGFNEIGIIAETGFVSEHKFNYEHKPTVLQRCIIWSANQISQNKTNRQNVKILMSSFFYLVASIFMVLFFLQSLKNFDVFIFGFRKSFLPKHLDLPILKFFRKKIIFVFHGSDARQPLLNGVYENLSVKQLIYLETKQKKSISIIEKYADHLITQPAISQCHNRSVINWIKVGMPVSKKNTKDKIFKDDFDILLSPPTILHCPSKPRAKGTEIVRGVVRELNSEGHSFHYKEIIDKSHNEVLQALDNCSFVIDQLYSDLHMAGFATEAAFFGKPAIVGGYELDKLANILGADHTAPTFRIEPTFNDLKKAIIFLLENTNERHEIGARAKRFVENNYRPSIVAGKFLKVLRNDIPEDWVIKPKSIKFEYGCGISSDDLSRRIRKTSEI